MRRRSALISLLLAATVTGAPAHAGASTAATSDSSTTLARSTQSGVLRMHPQISDAGDSAHRADLAKSAMTAAFKPVRKGRPVLLQRRTSSGWSTVAKGAENGRGEVDLVAAYAVSGVPATYRAVASRYNGAAKVTSAAVRTSDAGVPDFTDEFSGSQLGAAWTNRLQGYSPASLRKCSKADARAAKVANGTLRLSVLKDPDRTATKCRYDGKNYAWRLNGQVSTEPSTNPAGKAFLYGYSAARVKFQPRRGQHASFWMQPASRLAEEGSATQTGAEVDIIEWFGENHPQGGLTSFIYHYPDNHQAGVTAKKVGGFISDPGRFGSGWAKKYHVFSVEWTPSRYVFRIDGRETFRTSQGVSGQKEYLILSLLSSDYELGYLGAESRLPQTMSVDWIRHWAREAS